MLQLRKATINNDCDYNSCTIIQPQCPPGTTQQCPKTQCGPHQIGCQTPCNEAGMPTDGTDATCGACSPACACEPGYFDMDRYAANGCEYQCTPSNNGVEKCDNVDNNCNGQKDEGLPSCGCSGGIPTQETCNNRDDDCNGRVDEGLTGCACAQGPPAAEVCNGNDDNCNGQVDDGVGLCGAGSQCIRGSCSCTQTYSRSCAELDQKIKNRLERQGKWDNAKQSKKVVEHQGKYYACENKVDNACCTAYENGLPIGAGKVCVYNGKCYAPGMTIPLGDGATLQCS
ncbi:hypothetical protein HY639_03925 [Candidatus Woesearchaeota archaeon]|nr:hypothetical protein [Candidatus Woesearchaeota archaeon]